VVTTYGPAIVGHVIGDGPGASEAQNAVAAALMMAARPKTPANSAAERFGALPAAARHAWLVRHLAALRAGRVTLAELP
jgi:hypothetical protein